ncbi:cysteine hydrolase family protein [Ferrimonas marina]|uniref:Nicotinamidase-related amidase n=1 Tax=Ferrimonas marina TaxID=299255 RepID=A0A1M5RAN4_9GAMM|nr:isochorismatase family cysteine hydrolase [Ferrimonas marina]SHH23129.1 Nicotinamidase-related amidase [Ferrimonas marina]
MKALLIIDMQQDFVSPDGAACVAGALPSVPTLALALQQARLNGVPVIHIQRHHKADGSDSEPFRRHAPVCIEQTWGAEPIAELAPTEGETIVVKTRFSAFYRTELDSVLSELDCRELVVCGTQWPNCIRGTVMDALYRDHQVTVLTDACSGQSDAVAQANQEDLHNMGVICQTTEQWVAQLAER